MTPWQQVEAHWPLCNPEIQLLREQLQAVVGIVMMFEAIRNRPPIHEPPHQRTIQNPEVHDHMGD